VTSFRPSDFPSIVFPQRRPLVPVKSAPLRGRVRPTGPFCDPKLPWRVRLFSGFLFFRGFAPWASFRCLRFLPGRPLGVLCWTIGLQSPRRRLFCLTFEKCREKGIVWVASFFFGFERPVLSHPFFLSPSPPFFGFFLFFRIRYLSALWFFIRVGRCSWTGPPGDFFCTPVAVFFHSFNLVSPPWERTIGRNVLFVGGTVGVLSGASHVSFSLFFFPRSVFSQFCPAGAPSGRNCFSTPFFYDCLVS